MSRRSTAKVFAQRTCADVDCGVVFQATTDAHRYCSRRCLGRSDAEREHRRRYQLKHGREYGKHKSSQQRCWGCKKEIAGSDQEPLKQPPLCNDCAKSIAKQIEPFVLQALDDKLNLS